MTGKVFTKYNFKFVATISIGKHKTQYDVVTRSSVLIKKKDGKELFLSEAKDYFLRKVRVKLPSKRTLSLKKVMDRSIFTEITVYKK